MGSRAKTFLLPRSCGTPTTGQNAGWLLFAVHANPDRVGSSICALLVCALLVESSLSARRCHVFTEQSSRPRDRVQFRGRDVALPIEQQWGNVSAERPGQQSER